MTKEEFAKYQVETAFGCNYDTNNNEMRFAYNAILTGYKFCAEKALEILRNMVKYVNHPKDENFSITVPLLTKEEIETVKQKLMEE